MANISPLRYPGGKSKIAPLLAQYVPKDTTELLSPFFGGGSFELYLAQTRGMRIYGYDNFDPLISFWCCALYDAGIIADRVLDKYYPLTKKMFSDMQKFIMEDEEIWEVAAMFFALNRSSFSGSTLSGGMSVGHPRLNKQAIERLRAFHCDTVSVEKLDCGQSLARHPDMFAYLDPPYMIPNKLYGKNGDEHDSFHHVILYNSLKDRPNWIMTYNDCERIRRLYKDYDIIDLNPTYSMSNGNRKKEILILNI